MKKIFIAGPVRNASAETREFLDLFVEAMEKQGIKVHYPPRDTDQTDPVGNKICDTNLSAILEGDGVCIHFDKESQGTFFDIGGAYMLDLIARYIEKNGTKAVLELLKKRKKIVFINSEDFPESQGKSFPNVIKRWEKETQNS